MKRKLLAERRNEIHRFLLMVVTVMMITGFKRILQLAIQISLQFIISAAAVQKLSTYFLGKMRIHMIAAPDKEIIVSKDKVSTVKRWLDS